MILLSIQSVLFDTPEGDMKCRITAVLATRHKHPSVIRKNREFDVDEDMQAHQLMRIINEQQFALVVSAMEDLR